MYYEEQVIEEVRARNDIVDVISQAVRLEKKGGNYFGLCPFHNERTPSFSVSPAKQMFYCFGCGQGGNVFSFVQKYENLTWPEAVAYLAERAGVALPVSKRADKEKEIRSRRKLLLEINKEAAAWFYYRLREEEGKKGLEYLTGRGLSPQIMHTFGLGYAPVSRDALVRHLTEKGYETKDIVDAGLAVRDEKDGVKDKFWNRVMFPIQDVQRHVLGFGGRVMGDGEPKYLNSPETLVFDKGRNLYGLMIASKARKGRIILCEGYMDVIAMHRAGFTETAASLGTAFTAGQASVLKRYTDEVLLAYDTDGAGVKAALRAIRICKEAGIRAKVMTLAPYKDPDELITKEGAEEMDRRIRSALNPFFFEVSVAEKDYHFDDPAETTAFHRLIAEKLADAFPEAMERENYLQAICARYHIDPQSMKEAVALSGVRSAESVSVRQDVRRMRKAPGTEEVKSERMLISFLCGDKTVYPAVKDYVTAEDYTDPVCRRIADVLYEALEAGDMNPAALLDRFPEEDREEVSRVFNTPLGELTEISERERVLHDIVYEVMKRSYETMCATADPSDRTTLTKTIEGKKRLDEFRRKAITLS